MFKLDDFTGVIPALITPYGKDGEYDSKCSKEMVDWHISMGVGGFYLTGSNGSGPYMDSDERIRVVDTITEQVDGKVPVMAHVAAVSARLSAKMAKAAEKSGCMAVSAVPSYYSKLNMDEMVRYYTEIAEASDLPLIVYAQTHIYEPSVEMFRSLYEIEKVHGVKYTGPNLYMMGRIKKHLGKEFKVYAGYDEMMLAGLLYGADGVIGGSYNVIPDLYIRIKKKYDNKDIDGARKDFMVANDIVEYMISHDFDAAIHACYEFIGIDSGYNITPRYNYDSIEKAEFKKGLRELKEKSDVEGFALFDTI